MNNTELAWQEKLVENLQELDDTRRQASDKSINDYVQKNLQQIRNKNKQIVELTQEKEEIESKMLQEVSEEDLKKLQKQHLDLISEYENIIKQKIAIFTEMLKNLKTITGNNSVSIKNEEIISLKKLEIEIAERDVYQKKRVEIDYAREVETALQDIADADLIIAQRKQRILDLHKELEEAEQELRDFIKDNEDKDAELAEMENNI